jgi:hypothetical protein
MAVTSSDDGSDRGTARKVQHGLGKVISCSIRDEEVQRRGTVGGAKLGGRRPRRLRRLVILERPENEGEENEAVRGRVEDGELGLGLSQ